MTKAVFQRTVPLAGNDYLAITPRLLDKGLHLLKQYHIKCFPDETERVAKRIRSWVRAGHLPYDCRVEMQHGKYVRIIRSARKRELIASQ